MDTMNNEKLTALSAVLFGGSLILTAINIVIIVVALSQ
jgi:hypothetical protein